MGNCTISVVSLDRASNHIHSHSWAELAGGQYTSCGLEASPQSSLCALTLVDDKTDLGAIPESACALTTFIQLHCH